MGDVITFIIWAAVIQGLFLGLLYIFSKKTKSKANILLGLFLLSFIFVAITDILPFDFIGTYPINNYFTLPEVKLLFPVLLLHYVTEKLNRAKHYQLFFKINYILIGLIVSITAFNLILFFLKGISIHDLFSQPTFERFFFAYQYYAFFLSVIVFVICIRETLRYKKVVQNEFTDITMLQINWLWQFIFIQLPMIILWGIELGRIALGGRGQSDIVMVTWGFVTLFIYFISYKAFKNPNLFENVSEVVMKEVGLESERNTAHKCSPENNQNIIAEMETNAYYLNPELTIHVFAREIQISARLVSSCVNRNIGVNFNEWVNNYRVDKALHTIKSDDRNLLSIEGIGMEAGFKSRSAMYAAFRKKTGHSPGYYRNN